MSDVEAIESEAYEKNTKEQYEMLGRFVEAFEMMVSEVRETSIELAARDGRNRILVATALHHQALSAKPLFDIFRAMVVELLKDTLEELENKAKGIQEADRPLLGDGRGNPLPITIKDRDTLLGVLGFLQGKYESLANHRNDLLHGTWFVGYSSIDDPNSEEFHVRKLKATKQGLSAAALPKNAVQLKKLAEQCEDVHGWIAWLQTCLEGTLKVTDAFKFIDGTWWFVSPGGNRSTLS